MHRFAPILCILALLAFAAAGRAELVLEHYDIDSLSYLATAIVRVQVGDSKPVKTDDGNFLVYTVTVLDVFKGPIKSGASIEVTGLNEFNARREWPDMPIRGIRFEKAMSFTSFSRLTPDARYAMYHRSNALWTVIESGARLLDGQTVYSFVQFLPRGFFATTMPARTVWGGFVAMTPLTSPGSTTMTRQEFEARLKESDKVLAKFHELLAAPASPQTGDQIAAFLRDRPGLLKKERASSDALGSKLAQRLDTMSTPATVLRLMDGSPDGTKGQLEYLLQSRFGRGYLLDRVADGKESTQQRMKCAGILCDAGWAYSHEIDDLEKGKITRLDTDFAARLARLVGDNSGTPFVEQFLDGIARCADCPTPRDRRLSADLESAAGLLAGDYPKASPLEQYQIAETLMQISPATYRRVPGAGPLLTQVEPNWDFDAAMKKHSMHLRCRWRNELSVPAKLTMVLRPASGKPEIELAVNTGFGNIVNNFGYEWSANADIAKIPAGTYHAFLRVYVNSRPIGDGLGCEVRVP